MVVIKKTYLYQIHIKISQTLHNKAFERPFYWSPQSELNRWPHPYHGCALGNLFFFTNNWRPCNKPFLRFLYTLIFSLFRYKQPIYNPFGLKVTFILFHQKQSNNYFNITWISTSENLIPETVVFKNVIKATRLWETKLVNWGQANSPLRKKGDIMGL